MRTNWILTTAVVAMSVTAAVGAQSAKAMQQPSKGDDDEHDVYGLRGVRESRRRVPADTRSTAWARNPCTATRP